MPCSWKNDLNMKLALFMWYSFVTNKIVTLEKTPEINKLINRIEEVIAYPSVVVFSPAF